MWYCMEGKGHYLAWFVQLSSMASLKTILFCKEKTCKVGSISTFGSTRIFLQHNRTENAKTVHSCINNRPRCRCFMEQWDGWCLWMHYFGCDSLSLMQSRYDCYSTPSSSPSALNNRVLCSFLKTALTHRHRGLIVVLTIRLYSVKLWDYCSASGRGLN